MLPILNKSGDLGRGAIASARRSIGGATSRGVGGGLARWEEYSGNLIIDLISVKDEGTPKYFLAVTGCLKQEKIEKV